MYNVFRKCGACQFPDPSNHNEIRILLHDLLQRFYDPLVIASKKIGGLKYPPTALKLEISSSIIFSVIKF